VKGLVFRHSLAREAASAIGGRIDRRAFVSRFAPVRIEDVEEQPLPAEDLVRVETTFSGLCGSDVKQILLNGSRGNPLTALVSFPHVLGHEVVGRRLDTGEPASLRSRPPRPTSWLVKNRRAAVWPDGSLAGTTDSSENTQKRIRERS
jgi:Alcohol dehydrogenase GroES-like domain